MKALLLIALVGTAAIYTNNLKKVEVKNCVNSKQVCSINTMNYSPVDTVPGRKDTSWKRSGNSGKRDTTWKRNKKDTMPY